MNDAMLATQKEEVESREANDFVEMGKVSEETKGGFIGDWYDGGIGRWG